MTLTLTLLISFFSYHNIMACLNEISWPAHLRRTVAFLEFFVWQMAQCPPRVCCLPSWPRNTHLGRPESQTDVSSVCWHDRRCSLSQFSSVQFSHSVVSLCNPMNCTPGLPVHHQLPEFTQTHVHRVGDAIQPSHPLSSPSPPALNLSQHQGLFKSVNSLHEVA